MQQEWPPLLSLHPHKGSSVIRVLSPRKQKFRQRHLQWFTQEHSAGSSKARSVLLPAFLLPLSSFQRYLLGSELICSGGHNKIPQTEQLKQQEHIFLLFWGPEVRDPGANHTGLWRVLLLGLQTTVLPALLKQEKTLVLVLPVTYRTQ